MRGSDDGVVSLSFSIISNEIGRKIYLMMEKAFDGHPPICVLAGYDGSVIFLQSKKGDLKIPKETIAHSGFQEITGVYSDPAIRADISTDDWPYFYMPQRVYPRSYLFMVAIVLLLSLVFFVNFVSDRPRFSHASFFEVTIVTSRDIESDWTSIENVIQKGSAMKNFAAKSPKKKNTHKEDVEKHEAQAQEEPEPEPEKKDVSSIVDEWAPDIEELRKELSNLSEK